MMMVKYTGDNNDNTGDNDEAIPPGLNLKFNLNLWQKQAQSLATRAL